MAFGAAIGSQSTDSPDGVCPCRNRSTPVLPAAVCEGYDSHLQFLLAQKLFEACTHAGVVCRFRDRRLMGRLMVWLCLRCCFPGKTQAGSGTRLAPSVLVKLLRPSTTGSVANSGTGSRSDQNRPGQRRGRTALWTPTRTTRPAKFRLGTLAPHVHHAQVRPLHPQILYSDLAYTGPCTARTMAPCAPQSTHRRVGASWLCFWFARVDPTVTQLLKRSTR